MLLFPWDVGAILPHFMLQNSGVDLNAMRQLVYSILRDRARHELRGIDIPMRNFLLRTIHVRQPRSITTRYAPFGTGDRDHARTAHACGNLGRTATLRRCRRHRWRHSRRLHRRITLRERGLKVALVEKGRVGAEQSSRNWGWCRQQNRDARELPMATKSLDLWERFAAETGEDTGFQRCGLLYLSNDRSGTRRLGALAGFRATGWRDHAYARRRRGERARQGHRRVWKGGVFSPTDGTADPARAAPAVARAILQARRHACIRTAPLAASRPTAGRAFRRRHRAWHDPDANWPSLRAAPGPPPSAGSSASASPRPLSGRQSSRSARRREIPDALHTAASPSRAAATAAIPSRSAGAAASIPRRSRCASRQHFLPMFMRRWRSLSPGG